VLKFYLIFVVYLDKSFLKHEKSGYYLKISNEKEYVKNLRNAKVKNIL